MQCLSDEKEITNKSFSDKDLQKLCKSLKYIATKNDGKLNVKVSYTDGYSIEGDNAYIFRSQMFKRKKVNEIRCKLTTPKGSLYFKLRLKSCEKSFYVIKNIDKLEFNNQRKIIEDYLDVIEPSSMFRIVTKNHTTLLLSSIMIFLLSLILNNSIFKLNMLISVISSVIITSFCTIFMFISCQSVTLVRYNRNPIKKAVLYIVGVILTEVISFYVENGLGGLLNG